jgi:hypothetical protein
MSFVIQLSLLLAQKPSAAHSDFHSFRLESSKTF